MNEPGTLVCTCGQYIEYHTPYVIEKLGGVYSIKDGRAYYCKEFVLDRNNTDNKVYLSILEIKKKKDDLEICLAKLLEAYIEENGGDMPTNADHPAHTAKRLLESFRTSSPWKTPYEIAHAEWDKDRGHYLNENGPCDMKNKLGGKNES